MTPTAAGTFFPYTDPTPDLSGYLTFTVSVGGGEAHSMVMDTGSSGIVVAASRIAESTPMPDPPAPPRYSSSGNGYSGEWVLATVQLTAADGRGFTTAKPVAVFAATGMEDGAEPGVSMMGVGIRGLDTDARNEMNPFLNLPEMASGEFRTGYLLTRDGVRFGYDEAEMAAFATFPTNCADPDTTPAATVTLTPPAGSALQTYADTAPLLLDTGISYMIVTPRADAPQPDPGYLETVGTHEQWVGGVAVSLELGGETIWSFGTSDFGEPGTPAYARFARPSPTGIINTGRHLLASYDYLVDLTFGAAGAVGASGASGVVGLRAPTRQP